MCPPGSARKPVRHPGRESPKTLKVRRDVRRCPRGPLRTGDVPDSVWHSVGRHRRSGQPRAGLSRWPHTRWRGRAPISPWISDVKTETMAITPFVEELLKGIFQTEAVSSDHIAVPLIHSSLTVPSRQSHICAQPAPRGDGVAGSRVLSGASKWP